MNTASVTLIALAQMSPQSRQQDISAETALLHSLSALDPSPRMVSGSLSAPVSITIGTCTPASRTRRQSSRPSMSGRPTSRTIVSKRSLLTISRACAVAPHWTQTNSSCSSSCSARDWRNAPSSSTIRTLRPALMIRSVVARRLSVTPLQFIPNKQSNPIRSARWLPAGASLRRIECHQAVKCAFPFFRRLRPIWQTSARGA